MSDRTSLCWAFTGFGAFAVLAVVMVALGIAALAALCAAMSVADFGWGVVCYRKEFSEAASR